MKETREINNQVTLSGEIVSDFKFSHEVFGEGFYTGMLASERTSRVEDVIPIMVSDRLVDVKADWIGQLVRVTGQFRSCNKFDGDRNRLVLSLFAREFEDITEEREFGLEDENQILLDGYICKKPIYRKTPLGREIADILLAVNRPFGKSDYMPCIAWGRNAAYASRLEIGTRLHIAGRIQSREYQKKISETESESGVAYEVSVFRLEVVEDDQSKY